MKFLIYKNTKIIFSKDNFQANFFFRNSLKTK